jgi:hypothetical protein
MRRLAPVVTTMSAAGTVLVFLLHLDTVAVAGTVDHRTIIGIS